MKKDERILLANTKPLTAKIGDKVKARMWDEFWSIGTLKKITDGGFVVEHKAGYEITYTYCIDL